MRGVTSPPANVILDRLKRRFLAEHRRAPTGADMRMLRVLLSETGGDLDKLVRWAEAVRDTDDDVAALTAHRARVEYRALVAWKRSEKATAQDRGHERAPADLIENTKRRVGRPRGEKFGKIDQEIIFIAEQVAHTCAPGTSTKSIIKRAVQENWTPALGPSVEAVTARIYARMRRRWVTGGATILPDIASPLTARIRRRRAGIKNRPPAVKTRPRLNNLAISISQVTSSLVNLRRGVDMDGHDYTLKEWCAKRRVCRATFYNLKKKGKGPRTYKVGSVNHITTEADLEWQRDREAEAAERDA